MADKPATVLRSRAELEAAIRGHRATAAVLAEIGDKVGVDQEVRLMDRCLDELAARRGR